MERLLRFAHRMSIEDFRRAAHVRPIDGFGRRYEVILDGGSLGFADEPDPLAQVHQREVNNALYCCSKEAAPFMRGVVLPSLEALQAYPGLSPKFHRELYLVCMELQWSSEYSEQAAAEGWGIFNSGGESQIQRFDEEDLLEDDAHAWRVVMGSNEDHHLVARTIIFRDAPAEWLRMSLTTKQWLATTPDAPAQRMEG
jgi:hypothetical protein